MKAVEFVLLFGPSRLVRSGSMKKLILAAFAVTCATSVFAQGLIAFQNRLTGTIVTHVYAPLATATGFSQLGQGTADTPTGSTDWSAFTRIGATGVNVQYGGAYTLAQIIGAPGNNQPESSLVPANPVTSFRTGLGAGYVSPTTSTLNNVAYDSPATVEMVVWDNSSGLYPTWTDAFPAWTKGWIAAAESGRWNTTLGGTAPSPVLDGAESFNLYFIPIPEPSTIALLGLGVALLMIAWRRK